MDSNNTSMSVFNVKSMLKRMKGILLITLISIIFITKVEMNLYEESKRSIAEFNRQVSNKVSIDIYNGMEKLDYINKYINEDMKKYKDKYNEDIFLKNINRISSGSLFKYIGIVGMDGYINIGDNDKKVYVGDREYFKKSISGGNHVSKLIENRLEYELGTVYSRPLIINGKIKGAIVGIEPKEILDKNLVNNTFSDKVKVYIVTSNGNIVLGSKENLGMYRDIILKLINEKGNNGIDSFDEHGEKNVIAYNKVKNSNNWYAISIVPIAKVFTGTHSTIKLSLFTIILSLFLYVIIGTYEDIKNKKELEEASYVDSLTNLRNLLKFKLDAKKIILNRAKDYVCVIVAFDIKNFKAINELFGYDKGDKVLKMIADNIRSIEFENISARIGEDIFTLLFKIEDDEDFEKKIEYINKHVTKQRYINKKLELNTHIGVFKMKKECIEIDKALDNANKSRIESKKVGDKLYYLYNDELEYKIQQKLIVERDLKRSLKNEEFEILYQPKVDINSEKIVSAEALIRWKHKDVGYISPNIFIPIAEKNGDINLIGRWVIKEVCKEIKKCEVNKDNIVPIAINLSRVELYQNNLIDYIRNTMKRYDISPEYLEFEITETAALNDIDYINNRIRDIKSLGIKVSMDDFGTGSSNLSNLKRLDIDVLKIDRTLSIDIEEDEKTKSLLKAIINLAKEYNIDVVCEGIESREQVDILREFRCDMVQGYVYYRPLDICKLKKILKGNK